MLVSTPEGKQANPSSSQEQGASRVLELERKCRAARRRALAGHWAYDLPQHIEWERQLKAAREGGSP